MSWKTVDYAKFEQRLVEYFDKCNGRIVRDGSPTGRLSQCMPEIQRIPQIKRPLDK